MSKRGPTPKGEYAGKSQVLSTRIRPDTREALRSAAKASGRSLSQEIEYRLRRGFERDEKINDLFGSRRNYKLLQAVALCTELAIDPDDTDSLDKDWLDSPAKFEIARQMILKILDAYRPTGPVPKLSPFAELGASDTPASLLHAIQNADASLPLGASEKEHRLNAMKADLGDVAMRPTFFSGTADEFRSHADQIDRKRTRKSDKPKRRGSKS